MLRTHRRQSKAHTSRSNKNVKRRDILVELGIAPGSLLLATEPLRTPAWIGRGDAITVISTGGNGRCFKLLVLNQRGRQTTYSFRADQHNVPPLLVLT